MVNLNISKWGFQIKGGEGLKNILGQTWQPVITNYGCLKQNFFAPSRFYNWYWSYYYIEQN